VSYGLKIGLVLDKCERSTDECRLWSIMLCLNEVKANDVHAKMVKVTMVLSEAR
jgi:hypothetical protein